MGKKSAEVVEVLALTHARNDNALQPPVAREHQPVALLRRLIRLRERELEEMRLELAQHEYRQAAGTN